MILFEKKNRTHLEPALHNENLYDYYDRSARKDVSKVRDVLNEWFECYPETEKHELKSRFKKTFSSAFYELFIFSLFKNQGFAIIIHPKVPSSNKRPDFLLKKDDIEFYLEAKEARDKTIKQEAHQRRINQIYDSLNKIKSPNFFLRIEKLILKNERQPSTKKIISSIESELKKIDPDKVTELIQNFGFDGSPRIQIEDINLKLVVSLIPKDPEYRDKGGMPIGAYPFEVYWGGAEDSIKNSFSKKAKRYGKLDKPYIICINAIGSRFSGEYDVGNAVWGSIALSWSNDPNNKDEKLVRQKDGLFFSDNGPIFQNVSGILITYAMEFNIPVSKYWFIKHPFSNHDLDFSHFEMTYQYAKNDKININQGKSIGEILNIETNWLEDE
ncbi:hypothetical protein LA303_08000 [Candidatus Sulfidibacterium hydrothermale]|uniref:hypothetical protein n=1 Tax=Candidatus Sulfidibacterium hydrothermale TaxID=2875962 RepID=UPI001F0A443B|nr:hypothetical protein [Candidatus Sulfidibacterium hydrothermale]UBM61366.1 hypothetical protein LA303_08000 [Candidatus Sulfidibacterium hydrothermale]